MANMLQFVSFARSSYNDDALYIQSKNNVLTMFRWFVAGFVWLSLDCILLMVIIEASHGRQRNLGPITA